jgi:hypothetical protein
MDNKIPDQGKDPAKVHRQFSPYSGLYNPTNSSGYPVHPDQQFTSGSPYGAQSTGPTQQSFQSSPYTNTPPQGVPQQVPVTQASHHPITTGDVMLQTHPNIDLHPHGRVINPQDEVNLKSQQDKDRFMMEEQKLQTRFFRLVERSHNQILEDPWKSQYKRLSFYSSVTNFVVFFSWMGFYFTNTSEMKMSSKMKRMTVGFLLLYLFNNQFFYLYKYNITYKYFNKIYNGLRHSDIENKLSELRGDILEIR